MHHLMRTSETTTPRYGGPPSSGATPRRRPAVKTLLAACAVVVLCCAAGVRPAVSHVAAQTASNDDLIAQYVQTINDGFQSGDFSALATVLAPDVTLTQSTPAGKTTVLQGVQAVIDFYQNVVAVNNPGLQFTTDEIHDLSDTVVLTYEHAAPPQFTVQGRCTHVFVIQNGQIVRYDWTTYFAAMP